MHAWLWQRRCWQICSAISSLQRVIKATVVPGRTPVTKAKDDDDMEVLSALAVKINRCAKCC